MKLSHLFCLMMTALSGVPALGIAQTTTGAASAQDQLVHLNQVQVVGTHNSYHAGIAPNEQKLWLPKQANQLAMLRYVHQSLTKQLDGGVRQLELDVYADHAGGLYAHPMGPKLVANAGLPPDADFDPNHVMDKPGFKVMHVQDVDYRSVCQPFTACLQEIRTWSHAHPEHVPLFILVEPKQNVLTVPFPTTRPEPMTSAAFDALDAEIRSVFATEEMVTPDDVRGDDVTLNHAVLTRGWPTLAASRGKVVFLLDVRKLGPVYLEGHPSLKGRVLFTNAQPDQPDGAFIEMNTPSDPAIMDRVREGYLVRTRSDDPVKLVRNASTLRRDEALASGAQIVSTDYPKAEPEADTGFRVSMPDGTMLRCNPVNAPTGCHSDALESR